MHKTFRNSNNICHIRINFVDCLTKRTHCEEFHGKQLTSKFAYCMLTKGKNDRVFIQMDSAEQSNAVRFFLSSYHPSCRKGSKSVSKPSWTNDFFPNHLCFDKYLHNLQVPSFSDLCPYSGWTAKREPPRYSV